MSRPLLHRPAAEANAQDITPPLPPPRRGEATAWASGHNNAGRHRSAAPRARRATAGVVRLCGEGQGITVRHMAQEKEQRLWPSRGGHGSATARTVRKLDGTGSELGLTRLAPVARGAT